MSGYCSDGGSAHAQVRGGSDHKGGDTWVITLREDEHHIK